MKQGKRATLKVGFICENLSRYRASHHHKSWTFYHTRQSVRFAVGDRPASAAQARCCLAQDCPKLVTVFRGCPCILLVGWDTRREVRGALAALPCCFAVGPFLGRS